MMQTHENVKVLKLKNMINDSALLTLPLIPFIPDSQIIHVDSRCPTEEWHLL